MHLLIGYLIFVLFSLTIEILYCTFPHSKRNNDYERVPISLKLWSLILILISSILPLVNLITILIMFADMWDDCYTLEYEKIFPEEVQKRSLVLKSFNAFCNFFNTEIKI